jgi:hypothetical protein
MMHVQPCREVQERLEAFHDGELPLEEQILVQDHLRECVTCAVVAGELDAIGASLRAMAASLPDRVSDEVDRVPGRVLDRLRIEQQFTLVAQVRALFEDMHWVYPALGASVATLFCVVGSMSVLHAASQELRPDSLAGMIEYLANPGSNANPMRLDEGMMAPRARGTSDPFIPIGEEDGVFALNAVVTREGRIQGVEFVDEGAGHLRVKPADMMIMLNAASRAEFEPAQVRGGDAVAVSMVWVLASTTVRGRFDDGWFLRRPVEPRRSVVTQPAKKAPTEPPAPSSKPGVEDACPTG